MPGPFANPTVRMALLAAAVLVGLLGAVSILMIPPSDDELIRGWIHEKAREVEVREVENFPEGMAERVVVQRQAGPESWSHETLRSNIRAIYDQFPTIDIDIVEIGLTYPETEGTAVADVRFHWAVTTHLYPNMSSGSRDTTGDGDPEQAILRFARTDGRWLLEEASFNR